MQNISLHIEYLLRTHDCVILPGIGAFLRTRRPATCDEATGTISAPATQVCFNSSIVTSDGLLTHSVARRDKVSFEEASVMVSAAAESCRNALSHYGELAIGHLGLLRLDEEDRISFHPYRDLFDRIWTAVSPAAPTTDKTLEEEIPALMPDSRYYVLRVSRRAVRYAAMVAVCLLTAATLMLPSANRTAPDMTVSRQYASVVPGVEKLGAGNDRQASDASSHATDLAGTGTEVETHEQAAAVTEQPLRFYLIVATFSREDDCRKFIEMQPDSSSLGIISSGKVCRVYSAASSDRDALTATMASAEHKTLHPQSWIWENPDAE